jgi:S-adenosylmethionine:tRNA ribosyltransferase-isomerase
MVFSSDLLFLSLSRIPPLGVFHTIGPVLVSDFDFELPPELIAQQPPPQRGQSRMLNLNRQTGTWRDLSFEQLPDLLREGDVLVLNDSRVIPARLFGTRQGETTGKVEVLLTEQTGEWEWRALTRPARRMVLGRKVTFATADGETLLEATVQGSGEFGERLMQFAPVDDFFQRLDLLGHMPLPPYIQRQDDSADRDRYQTVFARQPGSVAAPTAGLHFTPEILEQIRARGVTVATVTLHVGLGTFQPVRVAELDQIRLHTERYSLPETTASAISQARRENRRIVAAGTTTVRVLEHCAAIDRLEAHSGTTSIFLSPGSPFRIVQALLTNFHLPQSTLLMLVSAFAGKDNTLAAYRHAVDAGYRFFSYGDCMFID